MILFPLTSDDKERLKRLNQDKATTFALKKLFLNNCIDNLNNGDVNLLAADRLAIEIIKQAFHELEIIQPNTPISRDNGNMV